LCLLLEIALGLRDVIAWYVRAKTQTRFPSTTTNRLRLLPPPPPPPPLSLPFVDAVVGVSQNLARSVFDASCALSVAVRESLVVNDERVVARRLWQGRSSAVDAPSHTAAPFLPLRPFEDFVFGRRRSASPHLWRRGSALSPSNGGFEPIEPRPRRFDNAAPSRRSRASQALREPTRPERN
jgi:hypothetical protein